MDESKRTRGRKINLIEKHYEKIDTWTFIVISISSGLRRPGGEQAESGDDKFGSF